MQGTNQFLTPPHCCHAKLTTAELYTRVSISLLTQVHAATHRAASLNARQAVARDTEAEMELLATLAAEAEEELLSNQWRKST
jgi:integrase/recombinase XerD